MWRIITAFVFIVGAESAPTRSPQQSASSCGVLAAEKLLNIYGSTMKVEASLLEREELNVGEIIEILNCNGLDYKAIKFSDSGFIGSLRRLKYPAIGHRYIDNNITQGHYALIIPTERSLTVCDSYSTDVENATDEYLEELSWSGYVIIDAREKLHKRSYFNVLRSDSNILLAFAIFGIVLAVLLFLTFRRRKYYVTRKN